MKLTVLQLREIARKKGIDVSGLIRKKELVDRILAAEVSVGKEESMQTNAKPVAHEPEAHEKEKSNEKAEKGAPHRKRRIDDEKLKEMRQHIAFMMSNKPSFFAIDAKLETAAIKYSEKNYYAALREIQEARRIASDVYSHFRLFTNALGIDAAEKALTDAVQRGAISEDRAEQLLHSAMEGFVEGTPAKREETLEKLEKETIAAYEKLMGDLGKDLEMRKKRAQELKSIGANVIEAMKILEDSENMIATLKLDQAKELLGTAGEMLKRIELSKMEEIKYHIPRVRTSIDEARSLDLDVKDAEQDLQKASYDFERGELKQCVDELLRAEKAVDGIVHQALSSNPTLRQSQLEKTKATMQRLAPFLTEAMSYGIEVSEAQHYLNNARMALERSDAMNAPRFARRADNLAKQYEEEIKRLKDGSRHASGVRCWQCKQEMLYDYPNKIRRCSNCGWFTRNPS
ncbi:MAG: hypothetical protein QXE18_04910 [Thermoplasmata archaeon]